MIKKKKARQKRKKEKKKEKKRIFVILSYFVFIYCDELIKEECQIQIWSGGPTT